MREWSLEPFPGYPAAGMCLGLLGGRIMEWGGNQKIRGFSPVVLLGIRGCRTGTPQGGIFGSSGSWAKSWEAGRTQFLCLELEEIREDGEKSFFPSN